MNRCHKEELDVVVKIIKKKNKRNNQILKLPIFEYALAECGAFVLLGKNIGKQEGTILMCFIERMSEAIRICVKRKQHEIGEHILAAVAVIVVQLQTRLDYFYHEDFVIFKREIHDYFACVYDEVHICVDALEALLDETHKPRNSLEDTDNCVVVHKELEIEQKVCLVSVISILGNENEDIGYTEETALCEMKFVAFEKLKDVLCRCFICHLGQLAVRLFAEFSMILHMLKKDMEFERNLCYKTKTKRRRLVHEESPNLVPLVATMKALVLVLKEEEACCCEEQSMIVV